jgi:hypothetical protein
MATRTNTEAESKLPVFVAKRSLDYPGWLIVQCPREDCDDIFLVRSSRWRRKYRTSGGNVVTGRSCPYCFRAARLPRKLD